MKKIWIILIVLAVIAGVIFILRGSEDSWIKDEKGMYIKHGAPSGTPDYVSEQQEALICAMNLYLEKKSESMEFDSQCLGTCGNYAVDIVHVPRTEEDNKVENQCEDYREGKVIGFIELDKEGKIIRVA